MHHAIQLATIMGFQIIAGYAVVMDTRIIPRDRAIYLHGELSEFEQIKHILDCIGKAVVASSKGAEAYSDEANRARAEEWASIAHEWVLSQSHSQMEVLS